VFNPYDKAHELVRAIQESDIYHDYIKAKHLVEEKPEYKEKILNFREKQMKLNHAQVFGEEVAEETIKEISLEYAKLNQVEEIARFMNAESQFIQMFNDIQKIIHDSLQVDFEQ